MTEPKYTLPGIINYFQSEFTKIEKTKLLNDLENAELKYKISKLESEKKNLIFINEILNRKIEELTGAVPDNGAIISTGPLEEISTIDLSIIKNSKENLTKSMKEIIYLFKTPTVDQFDYLNLQSVKYDTPPDLPELPNQEHMQRQQQQFPKPMKINNIENTIDDFTDEDNNIEDNFEFSDTETINLPPPNLEPLPNITFSTPPIKICIHDSALYTLFPHNLSIWDISPIRNSIQCKFTKPVNVLKFSESVVEFGVWEGSVYIIDDKNTLRKYLITTDSNDKVRIGEVIGNYEAGTRITNDKIVTLTPGKITIHKLNGELEYNIIKSDLKLIKNEFFIGWVDDIVITNNRLINYKNSTITATTNSNLNKYDNFFVLNDIKGGKKSKLNNDYDQFEKINTHNNKISIITKNSKLYIFDILNDGFIINNTQLQTTSPITIFKKFNKGLALVDTEGVKIFNNDIGLKSVLSLGTSVKDIFFWEDGGGVDYVGVVGEGVWFYHVDVD